MNAYLSAVIINAPADRHPQTLRFYQEVMTLSPVSEAPTENAFMGGGRSSPGRIDYLRQGDSVSGQLGIWADPDPSRSATGFEKEEGMPYPLILVFAVKQIEQIYQRAEAFGAKLIKEPNDWEIPGKGWAKGALFLDPLGALMDLTQLPSDNPTNPEGQISPVRRITLPAPNGRLAELESFYARTLGLKTYYDSTIAKKGKDSGLGVGDYQVHLKSMQSENSTEGMVGLMEYRQPEMPVKPFARFENGSFPLAFEFVVDAPQAVYETAMQNGAEAFDIGADSEKTAADQRFFIDPLGILVRLYRP